MRAAHAASTRRPPPAPAGSGAARRLPAREAAAWGWGPGPCAPARRPVLHACVPGVGAGFGIWGREAAGVEGWARGIPGMRGGRRQPARGLQTSSPTETRAAEPRDLKGRPTPTSAPDTRGRFQRRSDCAVFHLHPSSLLLGRALGWQGTSRHFLVCIRGLRRCSDFTGARSESQPLALSREGS